MHKCFALLADTSKELIIIEFNVDDIDCVY